MRKLNNAYKLQVVDLKKISEEYGKTRNMLIISSLFIFIKIVLGVEIEKVPVLDVILQSQEQYLLVLLILIIYFFIKLITEWFKFDKPERNKILFRIDFYLSTTLGLVAVILIMFRFTSDLFIWQFSILPTILILLVCEFVVATTFLNIENLVYIRSKAVSKKLGLPRIPISVRSTSIILVFDIIILVTLQLLIYYFANEPLKSNWFWILILPIIVHLFGSIPHFFFTSKERRQQIQEILDQHDAAYQVYGFDSFIDSKGSELYLATEEGDFNKVVNLLKKGKNPDDKNKLGWTPFLLSVANGDNKLIHLFLEYGADVNTTNTLGRSALHFACNYGYIDIVDILLKAGAKPNCIDMGHNGIPLHKAIMNGSIDVVKLLINNGADVSLKDHNGKTALDYAHENGNGEIAKILRLELNKINKNGNK